MSLEIKTVEFQDMLAKSIKGTRKTNKFAPAITSMLGIDVKNNVLTLTTTDGITYLYIINTVFNEDFYAVVDVEKFYKLVSKITSETITLTLTENALEVKGNGTYLIELALDENGDLVKYPDPRENLHVEDGKEHEIQKAVFTKMSTALSPSLLDSALSESSMQYMCYYCGDRIIATDSNVLSSYSYTLFDEPKLLRPEFIDLMDVIDDELVSLAELGSEILVEASGCMIYTKVLPQIETFAVDRIIPLLDGEFESECILSKDYLMQLLDRFSLFVDGYDNNAIKLEFTDNEVTVKSLNSGAIEALTMETVNNPVAFECYVDLSLLKEQVKTNSTTDVHLWYGVDNSVKLVDGDVIHVVALLDSFS